MPETCENSLGLVNSRISCARHTCENLTILIIISKAIVAVTPGLILGLHPPNERRRYKVTPPLIGWAHI